MVILHENQRFHLAFSVQSTLYLPLKTGITNIVGMEVQEESRKYLENSDNTFKKRRVSDEMNLNLHGNSDDTALCREKFKSNLIEDSTGAYREISVRFINKLGASNSNSSGSGSGSGSIQMGVGELSERDSDSQVENEQNDRKRSREKEAMAIIDKLGLTYHSLDATFAHVVPPSNIDSYSDQSLSLCNSISGPRPRSGIGNEIGDEIGNGIGDGIGMPVLQVILVDENKGTNKDSSPDDMSSLAYLRPTNNNHIFALVVLPAKSSLSTSEEASSGNTKAILKRTHSFAYLH